MIYHEIYFIRIVQETEGCDRARERERNCAIGSMLAATDADAAWQMNVTE